MVDIAAITVETEVEVTKDEADLGRIITAETTIRQIKTTKIQILIRIKIVSNNGQILIRKTFNKEILIKVHRKLHLKFSLRIRITCLIRNNQHILAIIADIQIISQKIVLRKVTRHNEERKCRSIKIKKTKNAAQDSTAYFST